MGIRIIKRFDQKGSVYQDSTVTLINELIKFFKS